MATAVASGVVALALQQNRALFPGAYLTSHTVKVILDYTAIPLRDDAGKLYDPLTQGTGGLNGGGAALLARSIDPTKPVGEPWLVAGVTPKTAHRRADVDLGADRRPGATTSSGVTGSS